MSDLCERLRALVIMDEVRSDNPLGREAADEIDSLRGVLKLQQGIAAGWLIEKDDEIASLRAQLATSQELCTKFEAAVGEDVGEILSLRAKLESAMDDNFIAVQKIFKLESRLESARKALELAEDVLSRAPFSTGIWPNGMHPQRGIEQIRAALTDETGK